MNICVYLRIVTDVKNHFFHNKQVVDACVNKMTLFKTWKGNSVFSQICLTEQLWLRTLRFLSYALNPSLPRSRFFGCHAKPCDGGYLNPISFSIYQLRLHETVFNFPLHNTTLPLTSYWGQNCPPIPPLSSLRANVDLGEGKVDSLPETYNDPYSVNGDEFPWNLILILSLQNHACRHVTLNRGISTQKTTTIWGRPGFWFLMRSIEFHHKTCYACFCFETNVLINKAFYLY